MKKDKEKIMTRIIKTYTLVLLIVFILKLIGLDYFGLGINNPIVKMIEKVATKYHLINVWYSITLYIYTYCIMSITCKDESKRLKLYVLAIMPISIGLNIITKHIESVALTIIIDFMYLLANVIVYNLITNKEFKGLIKRFITITILTILYQWISSITRASTIKVKTYSFIEHMLFDIDYLILMIITMKINRKREEKWEKEAGSCGDQQISLVKQLKKFQTKFTNKKKIVKTNKEKFEERLFFVLYLIWNIFTVMIVLLIAKLNNGLIECIFILFSFMMNKTVFGKAFHMKKASSCFIISNIIYYILVRMSFSVGISILVPVILGTLLAYIMSMLAKYKDFELYRGMSKEDLEMACKLHKLNKYETEILIEYYCEKKTDLQIALIHNYSIEAIKKQKKKAKEKLK